jgi:hypothetical protein
MERLQSDCENIFNGSKYCENAHPSTPFDCEKAFGQKGTNMGSEWNIIFHNHKTINLKNQNSDASKTKWQGWNKKWRC